MNKRVELQMIVAYNAIMNAEYFQTFIEVYRSRSFAEVAKKRNVAPSSITRIISALEGELGFKLFQRTTRRVSVTEKGEEFFKRILPIHEELKDIKEQLTDDQLSGILRITAPSSFSYLFLNDLIIKFQKNYPEVKVELLISDKNLDIIDERIDVAIRFGRLPDSSFIGSKLFDLDYVVCCSPKYLSNRKINAPNKLTNERLISFLLDRYNQAWKFRKGSREIDIEITPALKVTGALAIIDFMKNGAGVGVVPRRLVEKELKSKKLVQLLKSYEVTPTDFGAAAWMLYPSRDYVPLKVKHFVEFISSEIKI